MTASEPQAGCANLQALARNRKLDLGVADRVQEARVEALDAAQDETAAVQGGSIAEESAAGGLRGVVAAQDEVVAAAAEVAVNQTRRFNSRRKTRPIWRNATGATSAS